ncbi:MAG: efflux RND transporter permease subunit [Myxococcota bacterium]
MSLPAFSVRQVVFVNLSFVIVIVAGLVASQRIPIDFYPDISFNTAIVTTVWTGASADEVERLVTTKLEDEIRDVVGIKEMTSFSQADLSDLNVEWDETLSEIEYEAAINELRAAVDRVNDLPAEAEEPVIRELSVSEVNNVVMVAIVDAGGVGERALREVARDVERRIERLLGVRKATLRGDRDREIRVHVDRERALQYDLTLPEISAIIARNNQNVPAGSMKTPGREVTVRGLGNFATPAGLAATIVKKDPGGNHVRLGDVATVESGFEKRRMLARQDGRDAIVVGVSKQPDADINELVARVRGFVDGYRDLLPPGVEAIVTKDTSRMVRDRMGVMTSNLAVGIVLVLAVLWFTVGLRNALIVTVGIPFSFLCAFLLFPWFDITINTISIVGFVMVSGMLVDHAIVIVENVYRRVEEGEPLREAIIHGTEEVMWPVIATVATTLAAFTPMLMITGTSGEFSAILPKTVIVVLIGSLFEALVILPAHYLDWGSRAHVAGGHREDGRRGLWASLQRGSGRIRDAVDAWLERTRAAYLRAQGALLAHRYVFLMACTAALYFSCGVQQHVRVDLFPSDFDELFVSLRTPVDYSIDRTDAVMRDLERALEELPDDVAEYTTQVGLAFTADRDVVRGSNYAVAFVTLTGSERNKRNPDGALRRVRERVAAFADEHAHDIENLTVMPPRHGPPIGKPVAIRIASEDYETAKRISSEMQSELLATPGVFNVEDNLPEGPLELRVALHEHRASLYGLTFDDVATALRAANDGLVPSTFKDPRSDEDVDIRVLLQGAQRNEMADLLDVELRTATGQRIKLGDVARVEVARGYQRLYHHDAERAVIVYGDVDGQAATSISANDHMEARFADVTQRYPGVSVVYGGENQETERTMQDMLRALGIALLAIYAILATLFRSYLQPIVVMSVVAFAFIGVSLGLFITDGALSMWVMYATVGLAGIVVNDSLVLIDFVNKERDRGTPVAESVRLASQRRFRPILLTTVTTIAGLLPMSLGFPDKSLVFGPFATAIVFGLSVASLLTLFVVPAIYLSFEDLSEAWARRTGRTGRTGRRLAEGAVAGGREL